MASAASCADSAASRYVGTASPALATRLGEPVMWSYPVASVIRFDHQSPAEAFDQPVRAELVAEMARGRAAVSVRALAELVTSHFAIYGQRARNQLVREVEDAARRAATADPDRLRFQPRTGTSEARVVSLRSPEEFDRRGRTQGYKAVFSERARRRPAPQVSEQLDLFSVLDEAERATSDEVYENDSGSSDAGGQLETDDLAGSDGGGPR